MDLEQTWTRNLDILPCDDPVHDWRVLQKREKIVNVNDLARIHRSMGREENNWT